MLETLCAFWKRYGFIVRVDRFSDGSHGSLVWLAWLAWLAGSHGSLARTLSKLTSPLCFGFFRCRVDDVLQSLFSRQVQSALQNSCVYLNKTHYTYSTWYSLWSSPWRTPFYNTEKGPSSHRATSLCYFFQLARLILNDHFHSQLRLKMNSAIGLWFKERKKAKATTGTALNKTASICVI